MRKYRYCFFFLLAAVVIGLGGGLWCALGQGDGPRGIGNGEMERTEGEMGTGSETGSETETEMETETVREDRIVINQERIQPVPKEMKQEGEYLLVSEDGFLLVFGNHASEICLYTHIPITDFPESEQEKLRQGIWFSAMEEIYSYLESYTS